MRRIGYWLGREVSHVQKALTIHPNCHFQSRAGQICFSTSSPALAIRPQAWQARGWMLQQGVQARGWMQQGGQAWRNMATVRRMAPGGSVNARGIDIGARARRNQNRRLWTYALSFSCIAGFIIIVLSSFQDSLVFYVTPTDALNKFRSDPSKNKFRLGGLVLEGSVVQPASTTEMEFVVTDLVTDVLVRHKGPVPDLFREGHSVVVEGFLRPISTSSSSENSGAESFRPLSAGHVASEKARSNNCYFSAIDVLAKHDEKYMPKEVAAAIEKNRAAIEAAHAKPQPQLQTSQLQESEQVHS